MEVQKDFSELLRLFNAHDLVNVAPDVCALT